MNIFHKIFVNQSLNAGVSWLLSFLFLGVAVGSFLEGNLPFAGFTAGVFLLIAIPPLIRRDLWHMIPAEIVFLAALPLIWKGLGSDFVATHTLNYLSASAVALVILTELETYTELKSTISFTALFVSLITTSLAGLWALARWGSDIFIGTNFIVSEEILMLEFSGATSAGLIAGLGAKYYLEKREVLGHED